MADRGGGASPPGRPRGREHRTRVRHGHREPRPGRPGNAPASPRPVRPRPGRQASRLACPRPRSRRRHPPWPPRRRRPERRCPRPLCLPSCHWRGRPMSRTSTLPLGIASVGGLLPEETLLRIAGGNSGLPGAKPAAYHLAKDETVVDVAERSWTYLRGRYAAFKEQLTEGDPAVGITREYWLGRLFQELGYGHLP